MNDWASATAALRSTSTSSSRLAWNATSRHFDFVLRMYSVYNYGCAESSSTYEARTARPDHEAFGPVKNFESSSRSTLGLRPTDTIYYFDNARSLQRVHAVQVERVAWRICQTFLPLRTRTPPPSNNDTKTLLTQHNDTNNLPNDPEVSDFKSSSNEFPYTVSANGNKKTFN